MSDELSRGDLLLMRLYDVQIALLHEQNPDKARRLYALHAAGGTGNPDILLDMENILNE